MHPADYFDRLFIINLPDRTDRQVEMQSMLEMNGLSRQPGWAEFFPAIRPDSAGPFRSIGARGCFLSHLGILQQAKRDGLNHILIAEDDLEIAPEFLQHFSTLSEHLDNSNWTFAYFGHILSKRTTVIRDPTLRAVESTVPIATTHFYAVNGSQIARVADFLELILSRPAGHPEGGPMDVDGAYNTFRAQHPEDIILVADPSLGWQRSSRSDITTRWFETIPIVKNVVGLTRQVRHAMNRSRR